MLDCSESVPSLLSTAHPLSPPSQVTYDVCCLLIAWEWGKGLQRGKGIEIKTLSLQNRECQFNISHSIYMKGNKSEDHSEWSQDIEKESMIISNRKIPVSFKSSSNFLFRCPDVGNETHRLESIIPRWQRKIKHYVFPLLKPKVCLHDESNMKKVSHRSFWNFSFFCNIVSNIQLCFLQAGYLTTVGWKGGARARKEGSDWWEVQSISSWSFATCGGQGSLTYVVKPHEIAVFIGQNGYISAISYAATY